MSGMDKGGNMSKDYEAKWAGRQKFTEAAEAIGVPNDHIMAMMTTNGVTSVLYTETVEGALENISVFAVKLRRDSEGILRKDMVPVEFPAMLGDMNEDLKAFLESELGEPDA